MAKKKSKKVNKRPLSKSAMEKYLNCPFAYDQHYNKRVRPKYVGSPLYYGIGVDCGLNVILSGSKDDPIKAFLKGVSHIELGKMRPTRNDYDKDIISKDDRKKALKFLKTVGYRGDDCDGLYMELLTKDKLSAKQEKAFDYLGRMSLLCKAAITFKAYRKQIMPRIKKVHAIQKATKAGFLDIVADWDKKGNTFVIDNKTAGKEYDPNKTDYSFQLTDYAIDEKIDKIMFIVMPKKMEKDFKKKCQKCSKMCKTSHHTCNEQVDGKRCHGQFDVKMSVDITIQVVKGKVTPMMKKRVKEIRPAVEKAIECGSFPCSFGTCDNKWGKPCEYRELYWKGDMEGLEVVKERKKK